MTISADRLVGDQEQLVKAKLRPVDFLVPASAAFQRQIPSDVYPTQDDIRFPGVYTSKSVADLDTALEALRALASSEIKLLLRQHGGAVLFRGLPIRSPQDFSAFAHAIGIGPQPHEEVGQPPKRTVLAPGVKTANEGPPDAPIWVHNEYGWSTVHPAYLYFFALQAPTQGGETPINSGIELASRLKNDLPELYNELSAKVGWSRLPLPIHDRYEPRLDSRRVPLECMQVTSPVSSGHLHGLIIADGKDIEDGDTPEVARQKIEFQIRRHSNHFKWHDDGSVSVWHRVPVIRTHHATGLPTFFGNLLSAYGRSKYHNATQPPYLGTDGAYHPLPTYGDGSPIPVEWLERGFQIVEETHVLVKWQDGDVLLFDNHAVQHSRNAWKGERKVLASLWDGEEFPDRSPWV